MSYGDISGRARTSARNPSAFACCDLCSEWYNRVDLKKQMEYRGPAIEWTGFLVCYRCWTVPQPQLKPIILPPDPVPVIFPRPESFITDNLTGFCKQDFATIFTSEDGTKVFVMEFSTGAPATYPPALNPIVPPPPYGVQG